MFTAWFGHVQGEVSRQVVVFAMGGCGSKCTKKTALI